jgi:prophage tail gpP-like protein
VAGQLDPFSTDDTTRVSVVIEGTEYSNIKTYSYTSDMLTLGDPCAVEIPDPNRKLPGKIGLGGKMEFFTADPNVEGGKKIRRLLGLVTSRAAKASKKAGVAVQVAGADKGWHLAQTDAPKWFRLNGATFQVLFDKLLDPSWNFTGIDADNTANRKLNQGGAFVRAHILTPMLKFIPPVQTEIGQKIADILVEYARREKHLVNVSADGYLQFYQPDYTQPASYSFELHGADETDHTRNNVEDAGLIETIDGVFSAVQCVWMQLRAPKQQTNTNPNAGKFAVTYKPGTNPLPFKRRLQFSDPDQLDNEMALRRAQWKWQRGMFDAWEYTVVVKGHQQNGIFYVPDSIAQVNDTVLGVKGNYYVSAVKYERNRQVGTRTTLTLKKPNLLAA